MRRISIVVGCIAAMALTGPSMTAARYRVEFHFSRPVTTMDAFRQDQIACKREAITLRWAHWGGINRPSGGVYRGWSPPTFLRCMTDKGYRLDPNGYSTGRMRVAI